jgi:hypothetical protein
MSLTGPSRTIVIEPLQRPERVPVPAEPRPVPPVGPEKEPARPDPPRPDAEPAPA